MTAPGATTSAAMNLALLRGMAIAEIARAFGGGADPAPPSAAPDGPNQPARTAGASALPVSAAEAGAEAGRPASRQGDLPTLGPQRPGAAQWLAGLTPPRPMSDAPMPPALTRNAALLSAMSAAAGEGTAGAEAVPHRAAGSDPVAQQRPGAGGGLTDTRAGPAGRSTAGDGGPARVAVPDGAARNGQATPSGQMAGGPTPTATSFPLPGPPMGGGAMPVPSPAASVLPSDAAGGWTGADRTGPLPAPVAPTDGTVAPRDVQGRPVPAQGGGAVLPVPETARPVAPAPPVAGMTGAEGAAPPVQAGGEVAGRTDTGAAGGASVDRGADRLVPARSDGAPQASPAVAARQAEAPEQAQAPRSPDARAVADLPPPGPDAPRAVQVLHAALAAAVADAASFGAFPFMAEGRSGNAASMVIFNAAMIPSWPPALRFDQAMGGEKALRLGGAALAGMTPEQAAEYLAKMAAGFDFLLKVKKRLAATATEEKELLLGLFSFLGGALDALVRGLRMAVEQSLHQEEMLAELRIERDQKQGRRGRKRLDL